jgi:GGDEF domain-containing protein
MIYMLQRQSVVRRLKRQLYEAQAAVASAKREAMLQSFLSLPRIDHFRDMLAMEFRRASTSGSPLAAAVFTSPRSSTESLGRMTACLRSMLRRGESLCRISDHAVSVILPGMHVADAAFLATQAEQISGIPQGALLLKVTAYPDEVGSFAEFERELRGGLN